jgi:hypothetical protein
VAASRHWNVCPWSGKRANERTACILKQQPQQSQQQISVIDNFIYFLNYYNI